MNHSEMIEKYAETTGTTKADAKKTLEGVFGFVADQLAVGEEIRVNNFGIFNVKAKPASKGRNPSTGAEVEIAARNAPVFKAAKPLKDKLNAKA